MKKILVVGAGLSGCSIARLLKDKGFDVRIIEKRNHIGGNCYDERDRGICVHKYGVHAFHTNNENIWKFVNRFAEFNEYKHKVEAYVDGKNIPIPINKKTKEMIGDSEEILYEKIIKNYTQKQRGFQNKDAIKRLSVRDNYYEYYFYDKYQGVPLKGYTNMMQEMISGIPIEINKSFKKSNEDIIIYTGRIDEYYDYKFGELEYHKTKFDHKYIKGTKQKLAQVNYPNTEEFTRIIEHKYYYENIKDLPYSIITKEYPRKGDIECYPVSSNKNNKMYEKYKNISEKNVYFLGRLATYKYLNMDQVVEQALELTKIICQKKF